jgi:hypothetical protein
MFKLNVDFSLSQKVSSALSLLLVFILSAVVAWFSLSAANKIINSAPNADAFNIQKRMNDNNVDGY